jgi:methionyl aminopeptidase
LSHVLIASTYDAMMRGIAVVRPGATLGDISFEIQICAEAARVSLVRDFCGHGLGRADIGQVRPKTNVRFVLPT